jgi:antitoxin component of MazEF toxin-antitoxin module
MIKRKVMKFQDSYYVAIPKQLCELIGIGKGSVLGVEYENKKIILTPPREE